MVSFPSLPKVEYADYAGYRAALAPLVKPWLRQAWIAIVDPLNRTETRDSVTGAVTSVSWTPEWTGWARMQPLRSPLALKRAIDSTETRTVQFQPVEYPSDESGTALPHIRPGWQVVVMQCEADPHATEYQYYVMGAMNSSMAWNRTIDCQVNQEAFPDFDTSGWPQPPDSGS